MIRTHRIICERSALVQKRRGPKVHDRLDGDSTRTFWAFFGDRLEGLPRYELARRLSAAVQGKPSQRSFEGWLADAHLSFIAAEHVACAAMFAGLITDQDCDRIGFWLSKAYPPVGLGKGKLTERDADVLSSACANALLAAEKAYEDELDEVRNIVRSEVLRFGVSKRKGYGAVSLEQSARLSGPFKAILLGDMVYWINEPAAEARRKATREYMESSEYRAAQIKKLMEDLERDVKPEDLVRIRAAWGARPLRKRS